MPSRVLILIRSDSNSATMASTLNSSRATGFGGVVHRPGEAERHLTGGEFGDDVAGIRERAGEPVEFGHDQDVAGAAGGHRLAQPGPVPVRLAGVVDQQTHPRSA